MVRSVSIMDDGARRRGELIASPVFVLSIAVLLLNDHILKAAWPGLITGKLSDVAGVAMVAVLLTASCARPSIGFAATAVAFTLLKTVPPVAVIAAPVLGGLTRTDPTDLVALAVLLPLWRWANARGARSDKRVRRAPASPSERASVGLGRSWLIAVQIVAVGSAVFATTATSCDDEGVTAIAVDSGVLTTAGGATSSDGGRTWLAGGSTTEFVQPDQQRVACLDEVCVEVERGLVVERRNGRTVTLLDVQDDLSQLELLDPPGCAEPPFAGVAVVDVDGGRHVVVAMGWLGTLHRGPDEAWEWVAVDGFGVQRTDAGSDPLGIPVASSIGTKGFDFSLPVRAIVFIFVSAPIAMFVALPVLIAMAIRRKRGYGIAFAVCIPVGVVLGIVSLFSLPFINNGGRGTSAVAIVVGGLAIVTLVPLVLWYRRPVPSVEQIPYPDGPWNQGVDGRGRPLQPPHQEDRVG